MKKIINGKTYNSEYATNICTSTSNVTFEVDGTLVTTLANKTLMRKMVPKSGISPYKMFKKTEYGTTSWYSVDKDNVSTDAGEFFFLISVGQRYSGSDVTIIPASNEEARAFAESYADYSDIEKYFGSYDEFNYDSLQKIAADAEKATKVDELERKLREAEVKVTDAQTRAVNAETRENEQTDRIARLQAEIQNLQNVIASSNKND